MTGNPVVGSPTGTVQFYECGPTTTPTPCTSPAPRWAAAVSAHRRSQQHGHGRLAESFTPTATGYWCFAGAYSGDSNYAASC